MSLASPAPPRAVTRSQHVSTTLTRMKTTFRKSRMIDASGTGPPDDGIDAAITVAAGTANHTVR